jgi:hypothetical protein
LRLVHRIVVRGWVATIGPPYCGSEVGCTNCNNPPPYHNTVYQSEQSTSVPQYYVPIATTHLRTTIRWTNRIVIWRWVVPIGSLYCGSQVSSCDWYTILWFGGGLLRLVHRIVVRRWVVPIGISYCGAEVGCYDWYTVLWYGGGLLRLVHRIVIWRWVVPICSLYCGQSQQTISEPQYGGPIVTTHLRTTIRCTNRNNPPPNHNTVYQSQQPTSEPQYGVHRIVVRRWVVSIGAP